MTYLRATALKDSLEINALRAAAEHLGKALTQSETSYLRESEIAQYERDKNAILQHEIKVFEKKVKRERRGKFVASAAAVIIGIIALL